MFTVRTNLMQISRGGYTRVGFVEGIRVADTLWILPAEYRSFWLTIKISFDALEAYNDSVKNLASNLFAIKNLLTEMFIRITLGHSVMYIRKRMQVM